MINKGWDVYILLDMRISHLFLQKIRTTLSTHDAVASDTHLTYQLLYLFMDKDPAGFLHPVT